MIAHDQNATDDLVSEQGSGSRRYHLGSPLDTALPLLRALFEAQEAGLLLCSTRGRVLVANATMAALLGLATDRLRGMEAGDVLAHLARSVDDVPSRLAELRMLPTAAEAIVREELTIERPARTVVRWIARAVELGGETCHLVTCTDATVEIDLADAHSKLTTTDRLTGCMNRPGMEAALEREVARARRSRGGFSVAVIEVDAPAKAPGSRAGDDAVRAVARVLTRTLRTSDVGARWDGEQFVVLLPETDFVGAGICGERLRAAVATSYPGAASVTISVGVADWRREEAPGQTISRAVDRLFEAKSLGRNRVR